MQHLKSALNNQPALKKKAQEKAQCIMLQNATLGINLQLIKQFAKKHNVVVLQKQQHYLTTLNPRI